MALFGVTSPTCAPGHTYAHFCALTQVSDPAPATNEVQL